MTNIIELFINTCNSYSKKIALEDENDSYTYSRYFEDSQIIGIEIQNLISSRQKPIIVLVDGTVKNIVAFMGILFSGNFYIPIDSSQTEEQLYYIIETIQPELIISMDDFPCNQISDKIVTYGELFKNKSNSKKTAQLIFSETIYDPIFGMLTSGSTGIPKLVIKSHQSVIDMIEQFKNEFELGCHNIYGNQAPFYFDVSAKDIYLSMALGGTLVIIPRKFFSFPVQLIDYLNNKKVNTLIWSTFGLRLLEKFKTFKSRRFDNVDLVMFSGEIIPVNVIKYWMDNIKATYVNLYGTTETTFNCLYYRIDTKSLKMESIPIGKAFKNTKILILKDDNSIAKMNEIGEICVMGATLALGYYGDLERTLKSFCQNPYNRDYPERMYRTGDIGFMDNEGNIRFVARKDNQIKHMGHRIELEEIEIKVSSIDKIERCCCIYDIEKEKIILFYQAKNIIDSEIYDFLKNTIPKHMIPNKLFFMTELPINKNGKIDRALLKEKIKNVSKS